jgi:transposase
MRLAPGGLGRKLSAARAAQLLGTIRPTDQVQTERKGMAQELLNDVRKLDTQLAASKTRIQAAAAASATTVTEVYGVGPIVAALLIGHSGDIRRFRSKDHYATYNATAPIQASSGLGSATGSTRPATANSTTRYIWLRSPRSATTPQDVPTTSANSLKAKARRKHCGHSKRRVNDAVYRQLTLDANNR